MTESQAMRTVTIPTVAGAGRGPLIIPVQGGKSNIAMSNIAIMSRAIVAYIEAYFEENEGWEPVDLSGLDLRGCVFPERFRIKKVNLIRIKKVNLNGSNLSGNDLSYLCFSGADCLLKTDMSGADMTGTDCRGAIMVGTKMSGVRLCDSDLRRTEFLGVDLEDADMTGANMSGTNKNYIKILGCNLKNAKLDVSALLGHVKVGPLTREAAQAVGLSEGRELQPLKDPHVTTMYNGLPHVVLCGVGVCSNGILIADVSPDAKERARIYAETEGFPTISFKDAQCARGNVENEHPHCLTPGS